LEDLEQTKVAAHIERAQQQGRYAGTTDPLEYLTLHDCVTTHAGQTHATPAGLLSFGRNPQAILRHAVVDVGHYSGTQPVSFEVLHLEKNIGGTIFDQLSRVEEYIRRNTKHGMTLPERGFERIEVHEYPPAVVRELCVNMLAHRDYTIAGSAARVALYVDRIEWVSPGGLPPGIVVEHLLDSQQARNPMLLTILHEAGYVEAFGQGLDTVVQVLKQEQMPPPTFRDIGSAFIVSVRGRQFDRFELSGLHFLNETQRAIINAFHARSEVTLAELREVLPKLSYRGLQDNMRTLVDAGIIVREGQTRAVRYRLR
jgi:ATP-dependent DNA helicase RecG